MKEHFDYLSINHDINQPNDRSVNAEIAVLGACLVEADTCRRYLQHMQPEYFFPECHQNIVKAMRATAGHMISRMELRVNDNSMLTAMQACSVARYLHSQGLCDIILMDYLQLLRPESLRKETREQEVANCSRLMKALAKDLNIPVLLLSQLNREVETRRDQEPKLSDLRESGAIEQDADMVILLFRPAAAGLPNDTVTKIPGENLMVMNVAKNRNGMTRRFVCSHSDDMTKFTDYRNDTLSQLGIIPPPVSIHDSYTLFRDGE